MQNVQDFFANTMNVSLQSFHYDEPLTQPSNFIDFCAKYTMLSTEGSRRCNACLKEWADKVAKSDKPFIFECHAGMTNFAIPVIINGKYLASVLGGKIIVGEVDEQKFIDLAKEIGVDDDKYLEAAKEIRRLPLEKFEVIVESLSLVVNSIVSIAYANYNLARMGMEYKVPRNIAMEEWLFLNCENMKRPITAREFEVLKLIVSGKSNVEIAKELFISVHTAKAHVSSILEKFLVEDRVQVAVKAVREGLI